MKEQRPNLRSPNYGKITQGSVFCCAQSSRYPDCIVFGLTITARCDVAQNKYPILNYLPIVSLSDWLRRDGLDILIDQESAEQRGTLISLLRSANLSANLLGSVPLEQIQEVHFPCDAGNKAQKQKSKEFKVHVNLIRDFDKLTTTSDMHKQFEWFCKFRPKKVKDIIVRLSRNNVLGHYFFETLIPNDSVSKGFVCLLREVSTLPRSIAQELGRGISESRYEELRREKGIGGLLFQPDDLAMPVVEVGSPTIEHLLQSFSNLFGRIGISDPVDEVINEIIDRNLV